LFIDLESEELLKISGKDYYSCSSPSDLSSESPFIDTTLFCDGVINCGSIGDFGNDEDETLCDQIKRLVNDDQSINDNNSSSSKLEDASTDHPTNKIVSNNHRFGLGSLDSSYYYGQQADNNNNHPFFPYSPMPSSNNIINSNDQEDVYQSSLSPPTTILVIVFVIVVVMLVGTIIRFCCTKCVGTPLPLPTVSGGVHDPSNSNSLGIAALGENGVPTVFFQCSRVNYSNDLPPAYEELFPSWKLNLHHHHHEGAGNVNPAFEGDISICPATRETESSTNAVNGSSKQPPPSSV